MDTRNLKMYKFVDMTLASNFRFQVRLSKIPFQIGLATLLFYTTKQSEIQLIKNTLHHLRQ